MTSLLDATVARHPGPYAKPPRRKPRQVEGEFQKQVMKLLKIMLPRKTWMTSIEHRGPGAARGRVLKGMGVVSGVPDILLLWEGRTHWLELKAPKGVVSNVQRVCHAELEQAGSPTAVCKTLDEVIAALRGWGIPLRADARLL